MKKENVKNYFIFYLLIACMALILGVYNQMNDGQVSKEKVVYSFEK